MTYNVFGGTLNLALSIYKSAGATAPEEPMLHQLLWGKLVIRIIMARKCPSFQDVFLKCKTTRHDNNFKAGITTKKCNFNSGKLHQKAGVLPWTPLGTHTPGSPASWLHQLRNTSLVPVYL